MSVESPLPVEKSWQLASSFRAATGRTCR